MLYVHWDMLLFPKAAPHLPWNILSFTREIVYTLRDILKIPWAILLNRLYLSNTLEDIFRSSTDILKTLRTKFLLFCTAILLNYL